MFDITDQKSIQNKIRVLSENYSAILNISIAHSLRFVQYSFFLLSHHSGSISHSTVRIWLPTTSRFLKAEMGEISDENVTRHLMSILKETVLKTGKRRWNKCEVQG